MVIKYRWISDRHGIGRIDGDAMKDALAAIWEIGRCAIRGKADGVGYGHAGVKPNQFAAMKAIDRARALLGLAPTVPAPERALAMDSSIVRARHHIVGLERCMQRKAAMRDGADIEAVFGREQLALVVNESEHAGHDGKHMRGDRARRKIGPEQGSLEDIEPPGGICRRIIGAALAQQAMVPGKDRG